MYDMYVNNTLMAIHIMASFEHDMIANNDRSEHRDYNIVTEI